MATAVEPGRPKRLAVGGDLFQVTTERFLSLVDTCHDLESRRSSPVARVKSQRVEALVAESLLVCEVKHPPPLHAVERLDFPRQAVPFRFR